MYFRLAAIVLSVAALYGCAAPHPQVALGTELSPQKITGEKACEVPQHWKALALERVNTRQSISSGTIVQFEMPPDWVGDSLGSFRESEDPKERDQIHYPRWTWPVLFVSSTGEKRLYSAVSKNLLRTRYVTAILPDVRKSDVAAGHVYVLSGAMTKILTARGVSLPLKVGLDCLERINADFIRDFPSKPARLADAWVHPEITEMIRQDFPSTSFPGDGKFFALADQARNPKLVGHLRQVTDEERSAERGHQIVVFPFGIPTASSFIAGKVMATLNQLHVGPFGERTYSAYEASEALRNRLVQYRASIEALEKQLGLKNGPPPFILAFSGRISGWEIGQELASTVLDFWERYEALELAVEQRRAQKK